MNKQLLLCFCLLFSQAARSQHSCSPDPVLKNPFMLMFFKLMNEHTLSEGLHDFERLSSQKQFLIIGKYKYSPDNYPLIYGLAAAMQGVENEDLKAFRQHLNLAKKTYLQYSRYGTFKSGADAEHHFFQNQDYMDCALSLIEKLKAHPFHLIPSGKLDDKPESSVSSAIQPEKPVNRQATQTVPPARKPPLKFKISLRELAKPIEKKDRYDQPAMVQAVFFEKDSFEVDLTYQQNQEALGSILTALKNCRDCKLLLTGFADQTGSVEHNENLSKYRCKAVALYLRENGVDERWIDKRHYGELGTGKARKVEIAIYGSVKLIKP